MTGKQQFAYIAGFSAIFVIAIPLLILYSSGYRLDENFRVVKTGGVYLENTEYEVTVKINGKRVKTGRFERNILVRDLSPKTYLISVEKEGYRSWRKNVKVAGRKVEICYPLLIPARLDPQRVPRYLAATPEKKKNKREANEEYLEAMKLFNTSDKALKASKAKWEDGDLRAYGVETGGRLNRKVLIYAQKNKIYVKWTGSENKRPFFINASDKQVAYSSTRKILSFDFFPGRQDSILVLLSDLGLYAIEIDTRFGIHNIYKILSNCNRFAVEDVYLYYFSGKNMYRIDLDP